MSSKPDSDSQIAYNTKAKFNYFFEEFFEAGCALEGWEVKGLRAKRVNFAESYVLLKNGEAFLLGMHISPLNTTSTHTVADPTRTRKLLLHRKELAKIFSATQRSGFTCIPVSLFWVRGRVKCKIALAKGKQKGDKRETVKEREWQVQQRRLAKNKSLS